MTDPFVEATPDRAEVTGARAGGTAKGPSADAGRRLPSVDAFALTPAVAPAADHNPVYRALVGDRAEIVDLLAYAIYKQHKHDFREAFFAAAGRDPTAAELAAYRFLATAKLAGEDGSDTTGDFPAVEALAAPPLPARPAKKVQWRQVAWLIALLLGVIVIAGVALKGR